MCGYCFFQGGIKQHGSVMLSRMSTALGDILRSCIIFDHKPHGCSSIDQVKSDTYTAISWQHDHIGSPDQRFIFLVPRTLPALTKGELVATRARSWQRSGTGVVHAFVRNCRMSIEARLTLQNECQLRACSANIGKAGSFLMRSCRPAR